MTQDSVFHNGFQTGDARRYSAAAFHQILSHLHLGSGGYVIPSGTLNTLGVTFSAGQTVAVAAGSAFVAGVYYNNDASLNVVLDNNSTVYNRIDRIVIRVDWTAQTARIVAKRGTASASPAMPALTQEIGNIYEVSLATVFVPPNFTGFGDEYIYDDRVYILKPEEDYGIKNIMFNSEFIPYTSPTHAGYTANTPYPMWYSTTSSVTFISTTDKFDQQSRGRSLTVALTTGRDFYTYIYVNNDNTKRATLSFVIHVTNGSVDLSIDGGATTLRTLPKTAEPVVVTVRTTVGASGSNQAIEPHFSPTGTSATMRLGQMTLAIGNNAAPFLPQNEFIIYPYRFQTINGGAGDSGTVRKSYDVSVMTPPMKNAFSLANYADSLGSTVDSSSLSILANIFSTTLIDLFRIERGRIANSLPGYAHGMHGLDLAYGDPIYIWTQSATVTRTGSPSWTMDIIGIDI